MQGSRVKDFIKAVLAFKKKKHMEERESGYYIINGKRVLYWDGEKWMEAVKDAGGRYGSYVRPLEKQPKRIKSVEPYRTIFDI